MLVEINLLPRKERGNSSIIIGTGIFLIVCFLAASFFYWKIHSIETQINSIIRNIAEIQQLSAKEQKTVMDFETSDSVIKLKTSIDWAENYPIPSVPVMRSLTALLPERGFIQSFNYEETGTIMLTVQFDTSREAAFFLDRLNESKWIDEAGLNYLNAQDDSANVNGTDNSIPAAAVTANTEYIPRYIGEYEIKLNKEMIRKNGKSDNIQAGSDEGVAGS